MFKNVKKEDIATVLTELSETQNDKNIYKSSNPNKNSSANQEAVAAKVDSSHLQSESVQNLVTPLKKINIYIHSKEIEAIIDSGTQISIVHSSLIPDLQDQEETVTDKLSSDNLVTPLKKINIYIHSKEIEAIIDSGTQISIVHSSPIPDLQDQEESKILLTPAFGGQIEAKICRVSIYYKNSGNNFFNNVDTLITVTDKLNVPCLITPGIYELLANSEDDISHVFDGEIHSKREALTLHSEVKRQETESFSESAGEKEQLEQPIEVRRSDVSPSTRMKPEISEALENADGVTSSTGATRL
ncbi:hypothetical protein AVEN_129754-1 [Araneus ventricosus]|uniref:Uncharacterized protein n=1 Tax=Araneus ventricosus TaxID=182803 RepID=A0A4Y2WTV3_ARAVE|nr:hypothetical protein AVEN_129754-1 [Araneus ventricosus]